MDKDSSTNVIFTNDNSSPKNFCLSFIFKLIVVLNVLVGVLIGYYSSNVQGEKTFFFFTTQSNIWIGIVDFVFLTLVVIQQITRKNLIKAWMVRIKFVFVVSITLTMIVYLTALAPFMGGFAFSRYDLVVLHTIVPIFAIVDFLMMDYKANIKYIKSLLVIIPPLYYFVFVLICYYYKVPFMDSSEYGKQYFPYFFLNFESRVGWFGFNFDFSDRSQSMYFMGTFYWIILIFLFVIGIGLIYLSIQHFCYNKSIYNKISTKPEKKGHQISFVDDSTKGPIINFENRNIASCSISIVLKIVIIACAIFGVVDAALDCPKQYWYNFLLFFTEWSNILIALILIIILTIVLLQKMINRNLYKKWISVTHISIVVSTTITGLLFISTLLAPSNNLGSSVPAFQQLCLHFIVPLLSLVDLLAFSGFRRFNYRDALCGLIIPAIYMIFAFSCTSCNVSFDWTGSRNYPYDILNFKAPAGWFGFDFSNVKIANRIGTFYWIVVLGTLIYLLSLFYVVVLKMIYKNISLPLYYYFQSICKKNKNDISPSIINTWTILISKIIKVNGWDYQYVKDNKISSFTQIENLKTKKAFTDDEIKFLHNLRILRNAITHPEYSTRKPRTQLMPFEIRVYSHIDQVLDNLIKCNISRAKYH